MENFYMLPGDWAILAVALVFAVTGLFRGFSGSLAFVAAGAGSSATAMFFWRYLQQHEMATWVRGAITLTISLLVFGAIRTIIHRIVHKLLAQPADAIFGFVAGLALSVLLVVLWAAFGIGLEYSNIAREVAAYVG